MLRPSKTMMAGPVEFNKMSEESTRETKRTIISHIQIEATLSICGNTLSIKDFYIDIFRNNLLYVLQKNKSDVNIYYRNNRSLWRNWLSGGEKDNVIRCAQLAAFYDDAIEWNQELTTQSFIKGVVASLDSTADVKLKSYKFFGFLAGVQAVCIDALTPSNQSMHLRSMHLSGLRNDIIEALDNIRKTSESSDTNEPIKSYRVEYVRVLSEYRNKDKKQVSLMCAYTRGLFEGEIFKTGFFTLN